eukprot:scaffold37581_cov26-Prasinocladus_malaysianus.AAC.2
MHQIDAKRRDQTGRACMPSCARGRPPGWPAPSRGPPCPCPARPVLPQAARASMRRPPPPSFGPQSTAPPPDASPESKFVAT